MKTADLFFRFLSKYKAADAYFSNYYDDLFNRPLSDFLEEAEPEKYIGSAFLWNCTPQGVDYWANLQEGWGKVLSRWQEQTGEAGGHRC